MRPTILPAPMPPGLRRHPVSKRQAFYSCALALVFFPLLAAQEPVPVVLAEARIERVTEELLLTGTVTARQQSSLSPRTSGLVARVNVDAGDRVEAGAVLLSLDSTLASLGVQRAEAALAEARARLSESERRRNESRKLFEQRTVAETEAQTREAELRIATAAARQLEVELRERTEMLARHDVIAPFAGVVTRKLTDAGEWVATGTPVIELVDIDRARVDVQVPQERLGGIGDNTPVEIRLDSLPGSGLPGRIAARVPVSDPAARTALIRIEPTDSGVRLMPGVSASVVFRILSEDPVLTVPRDTLVRRPDGTINIWLALPEGGGWKASQRRVDPGRTFADLVEIRRGVEAGQRIVLRGNESLRDGQPLRIETAP